MRQPAPRLPIEPLARVLGIGTRHSEKAALELWPEVTTLRNWLRWKTEGGVPLKECDRIAITLRHHPVEIWGWEWVVRSEEWEAVCEAVRESQYRKKLRSNEARRRSRRAQAAAAAAAALPTSALAV